MKTVIERYNDEGVLVDRLEWDDTPFVIPLNPPHAPNCCPPGTVCMNVACPLRAQVT